MADRYRVSDYHLSIDCHVDDPGRLADSVIAAFCKMRADKARKDEEAFIFNLYDSGKKESTMTLGGLTPKLYAQRKADEAAKLAEAGKAMDGATIAPDPRKGMFNPNQLCTFEQAEKIGQELTRRGIGRGIAPITDSYETSGIFTLPWETGPGAFPEPGYSDATGDYFPILFRFNNGAAGVNAGLVADKLRRYPNSPDYVYMTINDEVKSMASE